MLGEAEPRLIIAMCAKLAEKSKCNGGLQSVLMSEAREYLEVRGRKISNLPISVHFREMLVSFSEKTFEGHCTFIVTTLDNERTHD